MGDKSKLPSPLLDSGEEILSKTEAQCLRTHERNARDLVLSFGEGDSATEVVEMEFNTPVRH